MGSLQQPTQATTQQLAYQQTQQSTKNNLGEHKNNKGSWAILVDTGAAISVAPRSFAPEIPLTALDRPAELRTATGALIRIFGKKNMHLLASKLCFEVSFLTADVTTPILGVDTLLRENLNLRIEGNQRQLVHQSGEYTQLLPEGQLLYLLAHPLQLGCDIYMIGSLLAKRILPANKPEQVALDLGAAQSIGEVLDKGGAYGNSFSQEDLDKEHNLGKNKTALGTAPLQQPGQQTAYKAKKKEPSAQGSSHQQLGMRREKQKGQQSAASKLRNNLRKPRSINKIELAMRAAEETTSLDSATRLDLGLRFLLTFSLINKWQIAAAKVGTAYQEGPSSTINLEELGLRTCAADSNIFFGEQLLVMMFQGELLIGGATSQQECFINKLSALDLLQGTTQLDNAPVIFQNKILEHNKLEHSVSLTIPVAFYMQLLKRHSLEHEPPMTLPQEELSTRASGQNTVLDAKQRKLYRKTVGQLLWSRVWRPDTSLAVEQLSLSLDNPTAQDLSQLCCLLRYLKGTMSYSLTLQPVSKKSLEKASHLELLAYSSTSWTKAASPTSTACLSCWGVTLATCCRQAREAWTQEAAELDSVVLAKQLASHYQSLVQGMQLDLALPVHLRVFFCSLTCELVTGRPLALQLGLSRRRRRVQLRTKKGQLELSKVLPAKNLAESLTKNLTPSGLHRLLPKLSVHTKAVDSQALLTRLSQEKPASFSGSSFFIGMVTLHPQIALTKASSTVLSLQLPSLTGGGEEIEKNIAFPQLATEQLQKRIVSRKSLQCHKPTQTSFDSLTRYSLSKQLCKKSFQSLSRQLCQNSFQEDSSQLYRDSFQSLNDQLCRIILQSFSEQLCSNTLESFRAYLCRNGFPSFKRSALHKELREFDLTASA